MAKVPGESKIPTGLRPPLPGAVRRTLSGLSAPKLLQSKLKLPSLTRTKPEFQDNNKLKQPTTRDQKTVKSIEADRDNKNECKVSSPRTNTDLKSPTVDNKSSKDSTFLLSEKSNECNSEKTFDVINEKDLTFNIRVNSDLRDNKDNENKDENTKKNEALKLNSQIGKNVWCVYNEPISKKVLQVTGILRYVGHVQSDGDIWCGIEADLPSRDFHNGCVNGVKYFNCKDNYGLLVPATQIKYQNIETTDPKILELKNKLQLVRNKAVKTHNSTKPNVIDITHQLVDDKIGCNQIESGPFSLLVGIDRPQGSDNKQFILNTTQTLQDHNTLPFMLSPPGVNQSKKLECPDKFPRLSDVKLIECESMIDLHSIDGTFDSIRLSIAPDFSKTSNAYGTAPFIDNESMVDFVSINLESIKNESTRQSLVISENEKCDLSNSVNFNSPNLQLVVASTPETTTFRSEKRKISCITDKNNSGYEKSNKQFVLGPLTRKQNNEGGANVEMKNAVDTKPCDNHVRISAENSEDLLSPSLSEPLVPQISKQNSFDESLGILTPDLMESASFLDNVRSPSVDDFNDLIENSKNTEKTVSSSSQTPSTENVKSLTPDALNSILVNESAIVDKSECTQLDNKCENSCLLSEETVAQSCNNVLIANLDQPNEIDQNYEDFARLPFKQSTSENMCESELGSVANNQNLDDELLPSVHSSILDPLSSVVDTTVNLDLPLDSRRYDAAHPPATGRMDQTPSPEELPLDPVDVRTDLSAISVTQFCGSIIQEQSQADSDTKTDTTKSVTSKVSNSFITSITSITSLDGYQGDGEMSRPVSRGADQSPTIGHRGVNNLQNHWQNIPINRRVDPMTDSDFFTESDADGHDELMHRGDRRAQVIDGALYGSGNSNNPPVMVNGNGNSNNEDSCMESSGVFTDMETHRCSPMLLNVIDDLSPEGSSPSTRSELSQKHNHSGHFYEGFNGSFNETVVTIHLLSPNKSDGFDGSKENIPSKRLSADDKLTVADEVEEISPNDKNNKDERNLALKKHKMPRRDVASKVKTMMSKSPDDSHPNKKQSVKNSKKNGRWDEVMNKISAGKSDAKPKSYLKDVKSKVTSRGDSLRKSMEDASQASGTTSPKIRTPPSKLKSRRVRSRLPEATATSGRSSPHSSQSDVSCGGPPPKHAPPKHTSTRSAKKRDGRPLSPSAVAPPQVQLQPQVQQPPLQPQQISPPRSQNAPVSAAPKQCNGVLVKKGSGVALNAARVPAPQRKVAPRRAATTLSPRQSPPTLKDHPRPPSPRAAPPPPVAVAPVPPVVLQPPPPNKGVEAFAVLVQYLVFQLDALNSPRWKAQALSTKAQLSDTTARLQMALNSQAADHHTLAEYLSKITDLENKLSAREAKFNASVLSITTEAESKYKSALEESAALSKEIRNLKSTLEQLQKEVKESRNIVKQCKKESKIREHQRATLEQELHRLKKENEQLRHSQPGSKEAILSAEVESLKSVLELKLSELSEERRRSEQVKQAATLLPAAQKRAQAAQTLADYLRSQLQRKLTDEAKLVQQNKQLHDSFVQLMAQKNRLSLHNEQLQYKLKHNSEVASLLAQSSLSEPGDDCERLNHTFPESFGNRANKNTCSFNEKYLRSCSYDDRTSRCSPHRSGRSESCSDKCDVSERNRALECFLNENSPPNSPKIKGVVEKNDSVSWIVEITEPPEETASRLVRRANSFRTTSSPRTTRENLKRQRSRPKGSPISPSHPLSQSASASSLESSGQGGAHCKLFRSNSIEHKQYTSSPVHSTPQKQNARRSSEKTRMSESIPLVRPRASSLTHDNRGHVKSFDHHDRSVSFTKDKNMDLEKAIMIAKQYNSEALVSNGELVLLQDCEPVPKESGGEALISGANSEDDSSLDDRSHSPSDSESVSESDKYLDMNGAGERLADPILQNIAEKMEQSLSNTPMEVSWSEDGECLISETDI